jgi:holo-[acyl-carrier protein] synthase
MYHIGIDIIEIARIQEAVNHWGEDFFHRVYTDSEVRQCRKSPSSLTARFAGKEAVIKALGIKSKGISWREIEILSQPSGKTLVRIYGRAQAEAASLGINEFIISLSHSKESAIAFVVGETK